MISWAKAKCMANSVEPSGTNLRQALGDAIHLLRFPLMEVVDFSDSEGNFKLAVVKIFSSYDVEE